MSHRILERIAAKPGWHRSLPILLGLAIPAAHAQAPAQEQAVTWTAQDTNIKWNPCPPFLPAGCGLAVLHGEPSKDNVDVFLKVPAKSILPRHWHSSAERMVLVTGEMRVTYDGQETAVLRAGSYAYGPAKVPHEGSCVSDGPCVLFIAFESPLDAVPTENGNK